MSILPSSSPQTALLIGQPLMCRRLERQLDLLENRPISMGWVIAAAGESALAPSDFSDEGPILGTLDDLELLIARRRPSIALICLPAAMKDLIASVRTRLRRLQIPDRFIPTLEDLVAGVGPRTQTDIDLAELLNRPPRAIDHEAVASVIAGKRVLITGAGGSIGSELARIVARFLPQQLVLVDRSENALFEIDRQIARSAPELSRKALLHDVVDVQGTLTHFRHLRPQVIFHAAAHKHVPMMEVHPAAAVDNNLFGTKSVADAAHAVAAERFVMVSTDKAVNPVSIMGATKRLAELYVQHISQLSSTAFSIVRFGNVLGSSGSVLEIWSRQLAEGGPLTVTDPRMTRYFMTIHEAAALVIQSAAITGGEAGAADVFLLDMGQPIRILDLAKRFIQLHGLEPALPNQPPQRGQGSVGIVTTGTRPGEKLHEQLHFDAECMRPTAHADINAWILPAPDPRHIEEMLLQLGLGRHRGDAAALAADIHRLTHPADHQIAA